MKQTNDLYYRCHAFFCTNKREDGRACCQDHNAAELRAYAKQKIKDLGLAGEGEVRINSAGCLDRCEDGPVIVIYPEGIWYTYRDEDDLDEIIAKHIIGGEVVEHLRI